MQNAAVKQNGQSKPRRMTLSNVQAGKRQEPLRVLLYSTEGLGKSTFASNAESPIFIDAERGTNEIDVPRFPQPTAWSDIFDAIEELLEAEHSFKTLVIDTLDALEPLCWDAVCDQPDPKTRAKHKSIEDWGFGRGYVKAVDEWRRLTIALDRLRSKRGMHVILLGHSQIKAFKNPEGEDYDRYQLKLNDKAGGFLRGWCDIVLFAKLETLTHETNGRAKGVDTGARVIHTRQSAAWDAKNRHDLPETIPLDWQDFAAAVSAHEPQSNEKLLAKIDELTHLADETLAQQVREVVEKANGDASMLAKIANRLQAKINLAQENA